MTGVDRGTVDFWAGAGPRSLVHLEKCKHEHELVSGNMGCPVRCVLRVQVL